MGSPVIADVTGDGRPEVLAASEDGGAQRVGRYAGKAVIADLHAPNNGSSMFFNSPAVADLDEDG